MLLWDSTPASLPALDMSVLTGRDWQWSGVETPTGTLNLAVTHVPVQSLQPWSLSGGSHPSILQAGRFTLLSRLIPPHCSPGAMLCQARPCLQRKRQREESCFQSKEGSRAPSCHTSVSGAHVVLPCPGLPRAEAGEPFGNWPTLVLPGSLSCSPARKMVGTHGIPGTPSESRTWRLPESAPFPGPYCLLSPAQPSLLVSSVLTQERLI